MTALPNGALRLWANLDFYVSMEKAALAPAEVVWSDDERPKSAIFDDFYNPESSTAKPIDPQTLFLQSNALPKRWIKLSPNSIFTLGETGFGLGHNFLKSWQLWLQAAPAGARLHFISCEKYPISKFDLIRAHQRWPELHTLAAQLQAAYPPLLAEGIHQLHLQPGNITLSLIIDDANAGFTSLQLEGSCDRAVDAWILDGFAPYKNPSMWSPALAQTLAQLSRPNASLVAAFGDIEIVKNFSAVGFQFDKTPTDQTSTVNLRARLTATPAKEFTTTPWHLANNCSENRQQTKVQTVAIIGAGIAGCTLARALAERGLQVEVFERSSQVASGASGNLQAALYARLSAKPGPNGDFNLHALQFALRYYRQYCPRAAHFCGLLQLAQKPTEIHAQQQVAARLTQFRAGALAHVVSAVEASRIAGLSLQHGGMFFPECGWLEPDKVCTELLRHVNIQLHVNTTLNHLEFANKRWQLQLQTTDSALSAFNADAVALCIANGVKQFAPTNPLPLISIRGQVSLASTSVLSQNLRSVLCGDGYIAPAHNQQHCFGATYKLKDEQTEIRLLENRQNLDTLAQLLPEVATEFSGMPLHGRASVRAATPDYLPLAGPVPKWDALEQTYRQLAKNRKQLIPQTATYWPGLHVLAGLGSRGFCYAPLAAEVVAAWVCNGLPPVSRQLVKALHPARFAVRALGKRQ